MSASMAAVLAAHIPTTSSMSSNQGEGGGSHGRSCSCGVTVTVEYAELGEAVSTEPFLNAKLAAHVAEILAANGHGNLEGAWDEGHYSGEWNYIHRRMIEHHPKEARKNPYRQDAEK